MHCAGGDSLWSLVETPGMIIVGSICVKVESYPPAGVHAMARKELIVGVNCVHVAHSLLSVCWESQRSLR